MKYGVVTGGISENFAHTYAGAGGSVTANVSKIELADKQLESMSKIHANHIKWREHTSTLVRLVSRYMASMKQVQQMCKNRERASKDQIQVEMNTLDKNKSDLELAVGSIFNEIEDTKREFIVEGPDFGNKNKNHKENNRTQESLRKVKNTLNFQKTHITTKEKTFKK